MTSLKFAPVLFLVPVVGLSLNISVLISLSRKNQLKKIPNIFFFNQALADTLFLSLLPFITLEYLLDSWFFGEIPCRLLIFLDSINQFSSVYILSVMSVDRYLGASRPLSRIQFRTKKYAWTLSAATWIASIVLCAPLWFISQSYGGQG